MAAPATYAPLRRLWSALSTRGVDASNHTESRAVMGANNFYVLTSLANLPWAVAILAHNGWSFIWPGVTHLAMIAVWVLALVRNRHGYTPWMSALGIAVAIVQYTFLAEVFSRSAGFQFALVGMPALAFAMFVPRHAKARAIVIAAAAIAALWVYLAPSVAEPWVVVTDRWLAWSAALMFASVLCLLMAQAAFADYYFNRERRRNGELLAEARTASHTDALTNLLNRRGVAPVMAAAAQQGTYSVALGDLDRFKRVNDALGHGAGDAVLTSVAAALAASVGDHGSVARWGGEEFLVVMPGLNLTAAEALMDRARTDLADSFSNGDVAVTISIGVVCAPRYAERDTVLRLTDAKLYEAKASGRNMVVGAALDMRGHRAAGATEQ